MPILLFYCLNCEVYNLHRIFKLFNENLAFFQIYDVKVFKGQSDIKWNTRYQEVLMIKFIWESFMKDVDHFQL